MCECNTCIIDCASVLLAVCVCELVQYMHNLPCKCAVPINFVRPITPYISLHYFTLQVALPLLIVSAAAWIVYAVVCSLLYKEISE